MTANRTISYFLDRYQTATLSGAIDRAVGSLTVPTLRGLDTASAAPVDLAAVCDTLKIRVADDLPEDACEEALLVPQGHGFIVQLRTSQSAARRRFSLAHEIGHALFYQDDGRGQRHQISSLSAVERAAEETICDRIASALLAPTPLIRQLVLACLEESPSGLIDGLDRAARRLKISLSALVTRLADLQLPDTSTLVLRLRFTENAITNYDSRLRIVGATCLSKRRGAPQIWHNVSANTIRFRSALALFDHWQEASGRDSGEPGRFGWDPDAGLYRRTTGDNRRAGIDETVTVWTQKGSRWEMSTLRARTSCVLYAPKGATRRDIQIVGAVEYASAG